MLTIQLIIFSVSCVVAIYLFNAFLSHRFKKIDYRYATLYVTTLALLGVFGEVLIDSLFKITLGKPLWEYHLLPIHHGYTSYYSLVVWGMYGFYLYIFHDFLRGRRSKLAKRYTSLIVAIEAILLEIAINLMFLAFFGGYIFYYLPSDALHLTSIQAIPFYLVLSVVISKCIKRFRTDPLFLLP